MKEATLINQIITFTFIDRMVDLGFRMLKNLFDKRPF